MPSDQPPDEASDVRVDDSPGRTPDAKAALNAVRVVDFRCFRELSCELAPASTLFVGDNAQGKTSLLEAVCVLLRLQSPRASSLDELIRFGQSGFGISGDFRGHRLQVTYRNSRRQLTVDNSSISRAADFLASSGLLVWMGNDDLQLVRGSGEARRRYLDFLGCQAFPEYRPALLNYEKALRSRNRLLKFESIDRRQLAAYTQLLVEHGQNLTALRQKLVQQISPFAGEAHRRISDRPEILALDFQPGTGADFAASLEASRDDEQRRRMTLVGSHRDDVLISLDALDAARFASEGQQRTIALALKLAQATLLENVRGTPPLLLVDDIFGELDPHRRNALLRSLPPGTQQLITATSLAWLDATFRPERIYRVSHGGLTS